MKKKRRRFETKVIPVMPSPNVAMSNDMTGMMPVPLITDGDEEGFAGLTDEMDEDEMRE